MNFVPHLEDLRDGSKCGSDFVGSDLQPFRRKLHPHQEIVRFFICVVIGVEDIAPEIVDKPGDAGNNALTVLAVDQENDGLFPVCRHVRIDRDSGTV